jgi:hypothetical protein
MKRFLFNFGYGTPASESYNKAHGTDDEFCKAIFVEAEDEKSALAWGQEIAEAYTKWLYKDDKVSWKAMKYANWIETDPEQHYDPSRIMNVRLGEYPNFAEFHERDI